MEAKISFKSVSCGAYHTVAIAQSGEVYACGLASRGQLGIKSHFEFLSELIKVSLPLSDTAEPFKIIQAHCGSYYTLLLTSTGQILSAGAGEIGINCDFDQDGTPITKDQPEFKVIPLHKFGGTKITFLAAGEHHAGAINESGHLFTWGLNIDSQCGIPCNPDGEFPQIISTPVQPFKDPSEKLTFVACGGRHTLALSSSHTVYAWGNNSFGQLGLSIEENESFSTPREVCHFREKIVSWLAAGTSHSVALTIEGYCYTWGRNNYGQIGHPDLVNPQIEIKLRAPKLIDYILGIGVAQAFCSYNQTFLGCADKLKNVPDTEVFAVWKSKLLKHEEKSTTSAS